MNQPVLHLRIVGTTRKYLVHEILNAVVRSKRNRIRQLDFSQLDHSQRGFLNIELHEPAQTLIRRISAVEGVLKVVST
ncbi:MAG: hypothetical protein QM669_07585 [Siphonobacter sp.]